MTKKNSLNRAYSYCMTWSIRAAAACWCTAKKKRPKMAKKQAAVSYTENDRQTLRSLFLRDNHHLLLA